MLRESNCRKKYPSGLKKKVHNIRALRKEGELKHLMACRCATIAAVKPEPDRDHTSTFFIIYLACSSYDTARR